jgi:6-phosphogluconolactonase
MLPADYAGAKSGAEIAIDPRGRFVYASNRGHDSIAIFRIHKGKLIPEGHTSTGGKNPRNFVLDPAGNFLLAANQDSGSVVEFRLDKRTGALTPTGERIAIPSPVSLVFSAPRASSAVSGRAPAD